MFISVLIVISLIVLFNSRAVGAPSMELHYAFQLILGYSSNDFIFIRKEEVSVIIELSLFLTLTLVRHAELYHSSYVSNFKSLILRLLTYTKACILN